MKAHVSNSLRQIMRDKVGREQLRNATFPIIITLSNGKQFVARTVPTRSA